MHFATVHAFATVIESSPTVVNGVVYVGSRDAKLYAFSLPDTRL